MKNNAWSFLFTAAVAVAGTGCVRETTPEMKPAGVVYFVEGTESPDRQWAVGKVKRPTVTVASGRRVRQEPVMALVRCTTGRQAFDFTYFNPRLDGTRQFVLDGAFAQPPAWSPDSSKLAVAFHNRRSEDLYVLRLTRNGWKEVALPPHNLHGDLHQVPVLRGRDFSWNSEQLTKLKWVKPDELHATYTAWLSPREGSAEYVYLFQGGRVRSAPVKMWAGEDEMGH